MPILMRQGWQVLLEAAAASAAAAVVMAAAKAEAEAAVVTAGARVGLGAVARVAGLAEMVAMMGVAVVTAVGWAVRVAPAGEMAVLAAATGRCHKWRGTEH